MSQEAVQSISQVASVRESASDTDTADQVAALFDQMWQRLLRYCLGLRLPAQDGEEIIQEAFLALFRHVREGKPRQNLRAWMFQVTHNLALKRREQDRRRRQNLIANGSLLEACRPADPEAELLASQRHSHLAGVWQALPEQDRACLVLRAEGLTYREIAEVLNTSLAGVSVSIARSLARFARADQR
jgi:RNA polymerase sigma-70 factor, ECF subfamily